MNRHERTWQAAAREHGFVPGQRSRSGHLRFRNPDNGEVVTTSSTPSDGFALRKFIADLRRANRRHLNPAAPGADQPPPTAALPYQLPQAAPHGRPAAFPSGGTPAMPTVPELTIGSLRAYADTLPTQNLPKAGVLRGAVAKVLDASGYLDTDRLIDIDIDELGAMLATARPDLSGNSRSTYLGQMKRVAQMLINQTAAQHGDAAPLLTRPTRHRDTPRRLETRAPEPVPAQTAAPVLTFPFPLRPAMTVTLTLPADLTAAEAERLAQMIRLLPTGPR